MTAEIEAIKTQVTPGADPVVDNAIDSLQALVITMQKNTAAAQAAVQPPPAPALATATDGATA